MPKFVIEREIQNAGKLTDEELRDISAKSCDVLNTMGPSIQWQESYVTNDKVYCVYIAASEDLLYEHAKRGGFSINSVATVHRVIDPSTAEMHS